MRRTFALVTLVVATCALAACAHAATPDPAGPTPGTGELAVPARSSDLGQSAVEEAGAGRTGIAVVGPARADLHLWVSNQSFTDEIVRLTVSIDGVEVVARPFNVANQHNWILFPVRIPPGRHEVRAVSDSGAVARQEFTIPERGRRFAVLDYWYHPGEGGRRITWRIQSTPMAFD